MPLFSPLLTVSQKGALRRKYLPQGARVLVVGCGTGIDAIYCAKNFPDVEVTVVDVSSGMLAQFQKLKNKAIPDNHNIKMVSHLVCKTLVAVGGEMCYRS